MCHIVSTPPCLQRLNQDGAGAGDSYNTRSQRCHCRSLSGILDALPNLLMPPGQALKIPGDSPQMWLGYCPMSLGIPHLEQGVLPAQYIQ